MQRVSVVIPTRNRRHYVGTAIRSALEQTVPPLEVIVVDDASTDETSPALKSEFGSAIRLETLRHNVERSRARNHGWSVAAGDLVAFLDSDDIWLPDKLEKQVRCFGDPGVLLVHGFVGKIDTNGSRLDRETATETAIFRSALARGYSWGTMLETWCRMYTSAVVVRRDLLDTTGGFDAAFSVFEDWDLFWRIARMGRVATVPEVVVMHRVHSGNTFESWKKAAAPWMRLTQKHLEAIEHLPRDREWRRAHRNLLVNLAIGAWWDRDYAGSRSAMRRAILRHPSLLARPFHTIWGAPLLHTLFPREHVERMSAKLGCNLYRDAPA